MAFKTFCDYCNKDLILDKDDITVRYAYSAKHFCNKYWTDKKNWPKIHKVQKKEK